MIVKIGVECEHVNDNINITCIELSGVPCMM